MTSPALHNSDSLTPAAYSVPPNLGSGSNLDNAGNVVYVSSPIQTAEDRLCHLVRPDMILQCAIYGNFSAPKAQEIVVSRGTIIELLQPDDNGRMQTICSTDVFGMIRSLTPFRLNGAGKDCIIVGSDSGRIVILEFNKVMSRPHSVQPKGHAVRLIVKSVQSSALLYH